MVKKQNKKARPSLLPKRDKVDLTPGQRFGIIITGIVLIILFGPLLIYSAQYIIAGQKVSQARKNNEPSYDNERAKRIATLQQTGVIATTSPTYSSKIDACYITHEDAGWIATNYYQDCYIRYTDLFAITLSRNEVEQKLHAGQKTSDLFGKLNTYQPGICDTLYENGENYTPSLIYLDWSYAEDDNDMSCRLPKPTQDIFTVRGPIVLDNHLTTKVTRTYEPSSVDKAKKYIFMQSDNYYYHEDLGCTIGGFVCSSPRSHPATGF